MNNIPKLAYLILVLVFCVDPATAGSHLSICHYQPDNNGWKQLTIGSPAVAKHLTNHDDALPGGTTTQSGLQLDADCAPVFTSCPCFSVEDATQALGDTREIAGGAVTETCLTGRTNGLPGTDLDSVRTDALAPLDDTFAMALAGPICVGSLNGVCFVMQQKCRLSKYVDGEREIFIENDYLTVEEIAACKTNVGIVAAEMGILCTEAD